jgi:long-chain acyl-CoA synthetase
MMGYWQDDQGTRTVLLDDGWLLTGDVAQMDKNGYFRIVSRKADMWYPDRRRGSPAFPRDVEEVIYEIPQVREACVTAVAGKPFAFVIAEAERPTAQAVLAYCRRRLPPHLVPRFVIFLDDFPRSYIGKVLRRELLTSGGFCPQRTGPQQDLIHEGGPPRGRRPGEPSHPQAVAPRPLRAAG